MWKLRTIRIVMAHCLSCLVGIWLTMSKIIYHSCATNFSPTLGYESYGLQYVYFCRCESYGCIVYLLNTRKYRKPNRVPELCGFFNLVNNMHRNWDQIVLPILRADSHINRDAESTV